MPRQIYTSAADEEVWDQARDLVGDDESLSRVVNAAIKGYVQQRSGSVTDEARARRIEDRHQMVRDVAGKIAADVPLSRREAQSFISACGNSAMRSLLVGRRERPR